MIPLFLFNYIMSMLKIVLLLRCFLVPYHIKSNSFAPYSCSLLHYVLPANGMNTLTILRPELGLGLL